MRGVAILCVMLSAFVAMAANDRAWMDWGKAHQVAEGVVLLKIEREVPRFLKAYLMRVDMTARKWRFAATGRAAEYGRPMPEHPDGKWRIGTERQTTRDFMLACRKPVSEGGRGLDMVVASNSTLWEPWQPPFTQRFAEPCGINISEGVVVSSNRPFGGVFVRWRDGRMEVRETLAPDQFGDVDLAASGFMLLLDDGKILVDAKRDHAPDPDTAWGVSKDGRYFYVLVTDGRQPEWSEGATACELAEMMQDAGAWDAIEMDGGGSSALTYWNGQEAVMVNRHDAERRKWRPTAVNVGLYAEE